MHREERLGEISGQALGVAAGATTASKEPPKVPKRFEIEKHSKVEEQEGIENERETKESFVLSLARSLAAPSFFPPRVGLGRHKTMLSS